APSWNRMAVACGLGETLRAVRVSISPYRPRLGCPTSQQYPPDRTHQRRSPRSLAQRSTAAPLWHPQFITGRLACGVQVRRCMNIPYRRLGRTGEMVSLIGVGGYHLGRQADEQEAIRIVRTAVDNGVNFLDHCWDCHGGASELRMGKALGDGYREKAFLMTKIDGRSKESATQQIE